MKYGPHVLIGIIAVLWLGLLLYHPAPPIEMLPGDVVAPTRARAGETVSVSRFFRVLRATHGTVARQMVNGDCNVRCEIVELQGGQLMLAPGEYKAVTRDYIIPSTAQPGVWRMVFVVTWSDVIGREHRITLPELSIEIVP